MPRNAKNVAYKAKEFETYLLWKSLPPHFRGLKISELKQYGFTDPLLSRIVKIKTQTEFARRFGIKDLGTLTDWNAKAEQQHLVKEVTAPAYEKELARVGKNVSESLIVSLQDKIRKQQKLITTLRKQLTQAEQTPKRSQPRRQRDERILSPTLVAKPISSQQPAVEKTTFAKRIKGFFSSWR